MMGGLMLGAVLWMGGCGASPDRTEPDRTGVMAITAESEMPEAVGLARTGPTEAEFHDETDRVLKVERIVHGDGSWTIKRSIAGRATRESVYAPGEGEWAGGVVLKEEVNSAEKVEVVFSPPLLVISGREMDATQSLRMTVHPKRNREKIRSQGGVENQVRWVGKEILQTPLGALEAWRIESTFTAELSPAHVVNETTQWYAPTLGLIGEDEHERTTFLGATVRESRASWRIATINTP